MTTQQGTPNPHMLPIGMGEEEQNRQIMDIAKEMLTETEKYTKSNITTQQVVLYARGIWFGERYRAPEIKTLVDVMLLLNRSKSGMALQYFRDTLKGMKPTIKTDNEGGQLI